MHESQRRDVEQKRCQTRKVLTVWFHLDEVQEPVKRTDGDRNWNGVPYRGMGMKYGKAQEGTFLSSGNVICLD